MKVLTGQAVNVSLIFHFHGCATRTGIRCTPCFQGALSKEDRSASFHREEVHRQQTPRRKPTTPGVFVRGTSVFCLAEEQFFFSTTNEKKKGEEKTLRQLTEHSDDRRGINEQTGLVRKLVVQSRVRRKTDKQTSRTEKNRNRWRERKKERETRDQLGSSL